MYYITVHMEIYHNMENVEFNRVTFIVLYKSQSPLLKKTLEKSVPHFVI